MGAGLCFDACQSLGDTGGLVFTLVAVAWGLWQRYLRSRALVEVVTERAAKDEAVKALSMRPLFVPVAPLEFKLPPPARVPEADTQEGAVSTDDPARTGG